MKISTIEKVIRGIPLFSSLSQSEIKALICSGKVQAYRIGEALSVENEIAIILKGSVTVTKQVGEKKLLMRILGAGSISGVASLFGDEHKPITTLTAEKMTEVLLVAHDTVAGLIEGNGAFAMSYIRFLTSRIRFLNGRIRAYTVSNTDAKLALHLLMSDENGTGEIELPVSLSTLADMLDMGRASLYRALEHLTENGIISRNGRKITILNRDDLKGVSDGSI